MSETNPTDPPPPPLTDAEIDEFEAALAKMTPAPWSARGRDVDAPSGGSLLTIYGVPTCAAYPHVDARGIALLRNRGASLVAEVRRLRAWKHDYLNAACDSPAADGIHCAKCASLSVVRTRAIAALESRAVAAEREVERLRIAAEIASECGECSRRIEESEADAKEPR